MPNVASLPNISKYNNNTHILWYHKSSSHETMRWFYRIQWDLCVAFNFFVFFFLSFVILILLIKFRILWVCVPFLNNKRQQHWNQYTSLQQKKNNNYAKHIKYHWIARKYLESQLSSKDYIIIIVFAFRFVCLILFGMEFDR